MVNNILITLYEDRWLLDLSWSLYTQMLNHYVVHLKLSSYYISTIFQLKKKAEDVDYNIVCIYKDLKNNKWTIGL